MTTWGQKWWCGCEVQHMIPSLASPLVVSEWGEGRPLLLLSTAGRWVAILATSQSQSPSLLSLWGWLATAGYREWHSQSSGQASVTVFLRGPTGSSGNQQTYNNVAMPSELNSDQLLTSFLLNLQSKIYFLICSFPCSINKTETLQRILFLGLHNKRQGCCLHNRDITWAQSL